MIVTDRQRRLAVLVRLYRVPRMIFSARRMRRFRMARTTALLVCVGLSGHLGCASAVGRQSEPIDASMDENLFAAAIRHLEEYVREEIRVDPRPMRNDPSIVSLHAITVVPERLVATRLDSVFSDATGRIREARENVLEELDVRSADAVRDARCPGVMVPPSPEVDERKRTYCPSQSYSSVVMALPRAGGPHWPGNVDRRDEYGDGHYSVRVIVRSVGPEGSSEVASDIVFLVSSPQSPTYVETVPLIIVE